MSVSRVGEVRRGRPSRLSKLIAELYRQGKCRDCTVNVTRMDFAKILGKFTKVKIQYESAPRPERVEKITSPSGNARLRSNENGMVLIHRAAYKEHPVKAAQPDMPSPAPRKRGRPPKNKPVEMTSVTRYRIVFYERRDSLDSASAPDDGNIADLLPAISSDVLPTDEWFIDYLLQDEPKNDRVYDRIAAELEDLMYDAKTAPTKTESKSDDFPSIMELLSDTLAESEPRRVPDEPTEPTRTEVESILTGEPNTDNDTESKINNENDKCSEIIDTVSSESKEESEEKSIADPSINATQTHLKNVTETPEKMEVDNVIEKTELAIDKPDPATTNTDSADVEKTESKNNKTDAGETSKVNGKVALIGDQNVNVETINYIIFKRVKNDECNRLVKCSKNLNYSIEIDGRPVQLVGAPKYISCVEDLRLMLQIVDESDLNSFNVVHGG